ncbi:hypothetical protein SAMN05445871_2377 [Paraburkholderia caballeronis]|uniref:Uncharacterized protein n=1 Tax=Paraburkholderia caballeronis TaxID=416943 RepID=A0A1H7U0D2_9BURK|nr:hypothetical protein C7403_110183 [Paraburkholderia caballeronis]PXW98437.1 hypothetical protein C7407_110183 [Paraburkholderia caballeronis]RAJ95168.1 hypothetical protein C7409_110184 [Paraburkholderia caballeronis]SEC53047.1 hypothetical protein SAMN05445871_2377 [Paraburkholderia caballeronis]SEL90530.1 hypothetical protein SAMN05192542_11773 [Paraburkholderia caballeronis]
MARRTLNASRLQEAVSRRIARQPEVVEDGVRIGVPRPQLQTPDADGCNWTMKHFGNAAGFEAVIADVLARVRAEYNLTVDEGETASAEADPTADPFGGSARASGAVNPFGESKAVGRVNPFGDAGPRKASDPFGSAAAGGDAADAPKTRPRDPFASD